MDGISNVNRKLGQNLAALFAFDQVARHGNFTGAAEALGLTQSALSQRVKALEVELGVLLFKREHRGVSLTNEGMRLLNVVRPSMTNMGTSLVSMMERKSRPRVRLSADFAFSTFWLLPRLAQLRSELDDEVEIQILASQTPPELNSDDCDIRIHVSPFENITDGDVLLLEERVAAVCSPQYLQENDGLLSSASLLDHQLLSLSRPASASWQTWQGWFDELKITGERTHNYISFNNYDMVMQSCMAGHGIALGWLGLVDDLFGKNLLVTATDDVVTSKAGYVMSRDFSNPSSGPQRVFDWIANQTRK